MTRDDEFERVVLAGLTGEIELSERYPGQRIFYTYEVARYLGWTKDEVDYKNPVTGEGSFLTAARISAQRETFYLYGAILKSREQRLAEWEDWEKDSGHKRYDHSDFGYSSWNCEWCRASFVGDRPGETPDPKLIRCEKDLHRNKPTIVDMKDFTLEEWA